MPQTSASTGLEQLRFPAQLIARADGRPIVRRARVLEDQSNTGTVLQFDVQAFVRRSGVAKRSDLRPFDTRDWPHHPTQRGRIGEVCHPRKADCPNATLQARLELHCHSFTNAPTAIIAPSTSIQPKLPMHTANMPTSRTPGPPLRPSSPRKEPPEAASSATSTRRPRRKQHNECAVAVALHRTRPASAGGVTDPIGMGPAKPVRSWRSRRGGRHRRRARHGGTTAADLKRTVYAQRHTPRAPRVLSNGRGGAARVGSRRSGRAPHRPRRRPDHRCRAG